MCWSNIIKKGLPNLLKHCLTNKMLAINVYNVSLRAFFLIMITNDNHNDMAPPDMVMSRCSWRATLRDCKYDRWMEDYRAQNLMQILLSRGLTCRTCPVPLHYKLLQKQTNTTHKKAVFV